jgi:hypothetical protein
MAAGVRNIDRRRLPDIAVAAHAPQGIHLLDLVGFERTRVARDVALGIALIPKLTSARSAEVIAVDRLPQMLVCSCW